MLESKGRYWPYIMIALLCFAILTLLSIEKEIKAQRTPDQVAAIEAQDIRERESKAYMEAEQEKEMELYRQAAWSDLNSDEYILKVVAEDYHILFLAFVIIASAPMLVGWFRKY